MVTHDSPLTTSSESSLLPSSPEMAQERAALEGLKACAEEHRSPKVSAASSFKTLLKQSNCHTDKVGKALDRFNDRLTLRNTRLTERYAKHDLSVVVVWRFAGGNVEYVANFQSANGFPFGKHAEGSERAKLEEKRGRYALEVGNKVNVDVGVSCQQRAVLVDSVYTVQDGQTLPLPSIVWLKRLDEVNRVLPQSTYFSLKTGFKLLGGSVSGEGDIPRAGATVGIVDKPQLLHQVVERGTTVLNRVTSDGTNRCRNGCSFGEVVDQLSSLRIAMSSDFVWAGTEERVDRLVEISEVLFGPFNFDNDEVHPLLGTHQWFSSRCPLEA